MICLQDQLRLEKEEKNNFQGSIQMFGFTNFRRQSLRKRMLFSILC